MQMDEKALLAVDCEMQFSSFIKQHMGINIHEHQINTLRETIIRACIHFAYEDSDAYLSALINGSPKSPEFEFLVAGITVGESYFFRDPAQIQLLRERLLPALIARKRETNQLTIRIWSAGCSKGQEIYTIAILIHQMLTDLSNWDIHLLGTDINNEAIISAKNAVFNTWSLRLTPPETREKYFIRVDDNFELKNSIRQHVKFMFLNLTEGNFPSIQTGTNALDIILCRNVFIYFDQKVIESVMEKFSLCLRNDGVLILGASDPAMKNSGLQYTQSQDASYFQRVSADRQEMGQAYEVSHLPPAPSHPITLTQTVSISDAEHKAGELVVAERWQEAITYLNEIEIENISSSALSRFKAKAFASLGQLDVALEAVDKSIRCTPDDLHTYLLRANILGELHRIDEAEGEIRKVLCRDHQLLEAHYELGLLLLGKGDTKMGLKSLHNALRIAENSLPEKCLHNARGTTHAQFAEILKNEIEVYKSLNVSAKAPFWPRK